MVPLVVSSRTRLTSGALVWTSTLSGSRTRGPGPATQLATSATASTRSRRTDGISARYRGGPWQASNPGRSDRAALDRLAGAVRQHLDADDEGAKAWVLGDALVPAIVDLLEH